MISKMGFLVVLQRRFVLQPGRFDYAYIKQQIAGRS
jgi:hypothetical protein